MEIKILYASLAGFFVLGSFFEYYVTRKHKPGYYSLKDIFISIRLMFTGLLVDAIIKLLALYLLLKLVPYAFFDLDYSWPVWVLCFVVWDFLFYWMHYLEHNVRLFWAIHVNHHSSKYLNLSTSLRSGIFKGVYRYFFIAPIFLIGFPLPMFLIIYVLGKLWAFFSHSQFLGNWGIFEHIVVTPTHHGVHHSCNDDNLGKNFGETLIVWDKLFGTFKSTKGALTFGIHEHVNESKFSNVVLHELKEMREDVSNANTFKEKLLYIFGKPGWKPQAVHSKKTLIEG
ncbi:sterol desaturase family protein [Fulvivirgaceae bacterium BMA10]|uniref:Sterol desaturase family protein n=1 Tax=Splendidivirga corallicola TaxID=3051826 RepID=A0ABT8KPX8_9BACT|nr:sterol desaturase family protein [Fulvivirgaceae bacterium BMA10]